jgi:SPP1 gp7 family putative phage head morphogenesis protein
MIVHLGQNPLPDARAAMQRFLEATKPAVRRALPSARQMKIERRRMQQKVVLTRQLRAELESALKRMADRMRSVLSAHGIHESDEASDADYADLKARIQMALATYSAHDLRAAVEPLIAKAIASGVSDAQAELAITTSFHIPQTRALNALEDYFLQFVHDVADREKQSIKAELSDGINAGLPTKVIAQNILASLDHEIHYVDDSGKIVRTVPADSWAEMVARTEVARAQNAGVIEAYRAAGVERVTFIAADDERTCPVCEELDGQTFDLSEIEGSDEEIPVHPSCRCTWVSADKELAPAQGEPAPEPDLVAA